MDKRQFEIVFRQQYSSLYNVALRYLQDGELAKDMVSEAFMAAWCRRDDIDGTKLENYLRACVRNKCLSQLGKPQPSTTAIDKQLVALMADDNDSEWLLREQRLTAMEKAVSNLSPRSRHVLERCYYQHQTYRQVADELGITTDGVKKHITKSMAVLRNCFNIIKEKK